MPVYNPRFSHQREHTRCTLLYLRTLFLASNWLAAVGYRWLIPRVVMKNSPLKLVATAMLGCCQGCRSLCPTASSLRTRGEEFLSDLSTENSCAFEQWVCFYLLDIVNCVTTRFPLSCWLLESLEPTFGPTLHRSRGFCGMHFHIYSWLHFLPTLVFLCLTYAALIYIVSYLIFFPWEKVKWHN